MNIELAYGDQARTFLAPSGTDVDFVSAGAGEPVVDLAAALERACEAPVESHALSKRLERLESDGAGAAKVLILVSDLTRSPATSAMLPAMVDRIQSCGVDRGDIRVLIARGTHRSLTREEKKFFRSGPLKGIPVDEHDCDDGASLSALTLTRRGTPVRIHRAVREARLVVLLSPVSFHYFAGFGGGRKLVLPGCADREAILANHRLSLCPGPPVTLHPSCRPGNLDGNPVHEDMAEAAQALTHLFAVNFFGDSEGNVTFINAGHPSHSHEEACAAYAHGFRVDVASPGKVVVASAGGYPYDINLLQVHKALYHSARAAVEGGAVLLFARCAEGVGSESLAAALEQPREQFLENAYEDYALNNQTAVSLRGLTSRYRVAMVTELDSPTCEAAGIEPCTNVEAWLAESLERQGGNRIIVIPNAATVLPNVED
jgi:nickel-dependent lactate racemase